MRQSDEWERQDIPRNDKIGYTLVAYIVGMFLICSGLLLQLRLMYPQYLNSDAFWADGQWLQKVLRQILWTVTPFAFLVTPVFFTVQYLTSFGTHPVHHSLLTRIEWPMRIPYSIFLSVVFCVGLYGMTVLIFDLLYSWRDVWKPTSDKEDWLRQVETRKIVRAYVYYHACIFW